MLAGKSQPHLAFLGSPSVEYSLEYQLYRMEIRVTEMEVRAKGHGSGLKHGAREESRGRR